MRKYLIELRLFGKAKKEARNLISEVKRKFHIHSKYRQVPHISLVGPFNTISQRRLIHDFNRICHSFPIMNFEIDGFNSFENSKVVYLDVKAGEKLKEFRWKLAKTLKSYCRLKPYDLKKKFEFHGTIAMKIHPKKFKKIKKYIKKKENPKYNHIVIRVTLIRGRKILREYDFMLQHSLKRRQAKSQKIMKRSWKLLKDYVEGMFNPNIIVPKKSFISSFKDYFEPKKKFIISDLHLDHKNIIKFCKRPFLDVNEMNYILVNNWNNTIRKKDTIYYLGDLSYGKGSRNADYWLKRLNGKVIFVGGNHDRAKRVKVLDKYILNYKGKKFYLVHDPKNIPKDWNGWIIHGHHHNNYPEKFAFINGKNKTINVSVERLNYTPLNLDDLFKVDFKHIGIMESINSIPKKK